MEIARVLRRFPCMVDVIRQRPMSILHTYMIEAYVTKDGSEVCLSLNPPKAFCARDGAVKETKLELEFSRYETYEEKIKEVYGPKGLLAFAAAAKEYVRVLWLFFLPAYPTYYSLFKISSATGGPQLCSIHRPPPP